MWKLAIAAIMFAGATLNALADDCTLPKFDPTNLPTSGEEHRALIVKLTEYKLCIAQKDDQAAARITFPGQAEMLASHIERLKSELELWRTRKTVPNLSKYREALAVEGIAETYTNFVVSLNIAGALFVENEMHIPSPYLAQMRAEGKNPSQEATRMSASTRFPPPKPWFTVTSVEISRANQDIALQRATKKLDTAKKRYAESKAYYKSVQTRVDDILAARREFIIKSTQKLQTINVKILDAVQANLPPGEDDIDAFARAQKDQADHIKAYHETDSELTTTLENVKASLDAVEQELSAATLEFVDVKSRYGSAIKSIQSKDARLVPVSADEQNALREEVYFLSAEIAGRREASFELDKRRLAAREHHEKAVNEASNQADWHALSGIASTIIQAQIELHSSALNLALAAKGGPTGVLAEATGQLAGNLISGPTYYDASGIGRDIAVIPQKKGNEENEQSWWDEQGKEAALNQIYKEAISTPFRTSGSYAKLNKAALEHEAAKFGADVYKSFRRPQDLVNGNFSLPDRIASKIAKSEEKVLKAAEEFGKATGKRGIGALVTSIGRDIGISVAKELTKEAMKKAAAELIEGGPLRDYMAAQLATHEAYADFLAKSRIYWANEEAIEVARVRRTAFLDRLKFGDLIVEKSDAFFPIPGYRFVIELEPNTSINPKNFRAGVELGNVKLVRDPKSTELAWIVPDEAEFGLELDEELKITITIK
jgi:hypothetical protein